MSGAPTDAPAYVASDLDRTLVWSRRHLGPEPLPALTCVETLDGRDQAFWTTDAATTLAGLAATGRLVAVTTRTPEQVRRLRLPPTPYLLCLNGARLVVDGVEDADHSRAMAERAAVVAPLAELLAAVAPVAQEPFVRRVREADGAFCYLLLAGEVSVPDDWWEEVEDVSAAHGWLVTREERRAYLTPGPLTKAAGVAALLERTGGVLLAAAGDSLLDAGMLDLAHRALVPHGSYLALAGWAHPRGEVTREGGVRGGAEVAAWLAEEARRGFGPPRGR